MARRLAYADDTDSATVKIAAAINAANFPPVAVCMVPDTWDSSEKGATPEVDFDVWAPESLTLTVAEVLAGRLRALTIAATEATGVTHGSDLFTKVGHGLVTGDGPIQLTNVGGALPAGSAPLTNYWIVRLDDDTFSIATTLANALAQTPVVVNLTGNGTGTHSYTGTASCKRVYWHNALTLPASIALTKQRAITRQVPHAGDVVAYGMVGALSAGTLFFGIRARSDR